MILYCDTSALAKCYVHEVHSEWIMEQRRNAELLAISVIGFTELHSAIQRKRRESLISERDCLRLLERVHSEWESLVRVELSSTINDVAARLLREHPLRAFDAIHLASALLLRERLKGREVLFAGFDARQIEAAEREGIAVLSLDRGRSFETTDTP